ncbi:hypothetical protein [Cyanobium sp. N5-Cardenillas]|uniref:hypothetical protein n=1 Tax=Cyanobium sp. N5-Cardenillas TaxID=2823720 RepID=UPI0020CF7FAC|nr:hypothetical protein [Cyanobium sp. N5-Cardenillas]MCP9786790.1 hypothetical protein [Cyanobium sp. N5-Cardenillas]
MTATTSSHTSPGAAAPPTALFHWPAVATHVALLRSRQRPEALVLLTLFPPQPAPGEPRGWSTYYLATTAQVLAGDPGLAAAIEADLHRHPGHSLGLIVSEPHPQPAGWGSRPEHFNAPKIRDGVAQTAEQQQAERERRCAAWVSGSAAPWCRPIYWGSRADHIAPCRWLFAECDREGISGADQLALAAAVFGAPPTFSVSTGGKSIHCYWRLVEPITPERFTELQKLAVAAYRHLEPDCAVDGSLSNPNRVLRLAGGHHPRTGRLATIHSAAATVLDPDSLAVRLRALQPPPPPAPPLRQHRPRPAAAGHRGGPVTMEKIRAGLDRIPPYASKQGQREKFILFVGGLRAAVREAGGSDADALALALEHSPGVLDAADYWAYDWTRTTAGSFWYQVGAGR